LYLGSTERITENGSTSFKRYLGGVAIATYYPSTGVQQLAYLLKDHIGSIHTVLNEAGAITTRMHFSAFGQRHKIIEDTHVSKISRMMGVREKIFVSTTRQVIPSTCTCTPPAAIFRSRASVVPTG
jgi:hypothetical protein